MVGQKVAIVSDVPQTTRTTIRAVLTGLDHQVVFTDTPGLHKPRTELGRHLNQRVDEAASGVDALVLVVDAAAGVGRGDGFVAARELEGRSAPKLCAVNKIDRLRRSRVLPQLAAAAELAAFDHVVPVSARTGAGIEDLRSTILSLMPDGPALYPAGSVTDQPAEHRVAELVREKALALTEQEVPHSIAVVVEGIERNDATGVLTISCSLLVERESQKGILVGKGGRTIREIGTRARPEIEAMLGGAVFLDLRVRVLKDWQRDPEALRRLGL